MILEGQAGRFTQRIAGIIAARFTGLNSMPVAQVEGEGDEMSRAGLRYHLCTSGATGIAPVQTFPTTAAQWFLYNPVTSNVTAYVDWIGEWLVSGTAGAGATVHGTLAGPGQVPTTITNASAANVVIANANPASSKASNLFVASAVTLVGTTNRWFPLAFMNPAATVLGQTQMEQRDIRGRLMIPPGCGLGLAVVSPTGTTPLFVPYGCWREYSSDNE